MKTLTTLVLTTLLTGCAMVQPIITPYACLAKTGSMEYNLITKGCKR